jgi:hypothetical protein
MILKGIVTGTDTLGTRVTFKDRDNNVSAPLKKSSHIGNLELGDFVAVVFFSNNMTDGIIIARW